MRAAILLAAGGSRRFGRRNKLLEPLAGKPLLAWALAAALAAPVQRVIVVAGSDRARVIRVVCGQRTSRIAIVHAARWASGIAASLLRARAALRPIDRQVFIFLADMPDIPRRLPIRLARALGAGVDAVRAHYEGRPAHPVLLRSDFLHSASLEGDEGLGRAIARLPAHRRVEIDSSARSVRDIDRVRDLRNLRQVFAARGEKRRPVG